MSENTQPVTPPETPVPPLEYNAIGFNYAERQHFRYQGPPLIDFHAHVTMTSVEDKPNGPAGGQGSAGSSDQAALMMEVADEFNIGTTISMCPAKDIAPLRERLGKRLLFNGMINKKLEEPDDAAYRSLDEFLNAGVALIKLWSAPRGRERGLFVDAPWRIESVKRARAAGIKMVMVHVGDPDVWWTHTYQDTEKFGTKSDQYVPFRRMLELFPDMIWIGAHMGGDPEHPDHLEELLEKYPHLYFDTSATKWQVREVSPRAEAIRSLICRYSDRFLFGSDLVTRHMLSREHFVSRYWCQRTLWESEWTGQSPMLDPDFRSTQDGEITPTLRGVGLPEAVLQKVYFGNASRLLDGLI